ncbi:MAG: hypothetical protein WC444_05465 [Candidatus Paceibacterota bacterium]
MLADFSLLELWIDGFIGYGTVRLDLSKEGVTYIRGKTGSGKSTIPEAIFYLLFGDTLRESTSVQDLENKYVGGGYEIGLKYKKGKHTYQVCEIRNRGKKDGLYFAEDAELDFGVRDDVKSVKKKILESVGMTKEEFCAKAFIGQNQSYALIKGTPEKRAKTLVKMFSLDKYDSPISEIDAHVKQLKSKVLDIDKDLVGVRGKIAELSSVLSSLEKPQEVVSESADELEGKLEKIKAKIKKIRQMESDNTKKIGDINFADKVRNNCEKMQEEVKLLKGSLNEFSGLPELSVVDKEILKIDKQVAAIEHELQSINVSIRKLDNLNPLCPVNNKDCPVNVPAEYRDSNLKDLNCRQSELNKQKGELEKGREEKSKIKSKARSKEEITTKIRIKMGEIDKYSDVELPEKTKEELEAEIKKCYEAIEEGDEKAHEIEEKIRAIRTYQELVTSYEKSTKTATERIQRCEEDTKRLESEKADLGVAIGYASLSLSAFKLLRSYKIDLVIDNLNANLQRNLDRIFEGDIKASFKSKDESSDSKRMIERVTMDFMKSSSMTPIPIGMVSGGQEAYVTVALILAIRETVESLHGDKLSFMFLDEVFGPVSDDMVNSVFESMAAICRDVGISSLKVISHKNIDESLCDHIWDVSSDGEISSLVETK